MDQDSLEHVEQQLTVMPSFVAPRELRTLVLADLRRELRASRWDRRLARAAVALLVVGAALNAGIIVQERIAYSAAGRTGAQMTSRQALVDTAVLVAEATDAVTGSRYARQLAVMSGRELTADEAAAIDAAIGRSPAVHHNDNRSKG
jgi:hypothetical protein